MRGNKPAIIFRLTPYQKGRLKRLSLKVKKMARSGEPGAVLMQPWEDKDYAGSKWNILKAGFIPNDQAKRIQKILEEI